VIGRPVRWLLDVSGVQLLLDYVRARPAVPDRAPRERDEALSVASLPWNGAP
jgi:hypothetical protein